MKFRTQSLNLSEAIPDTDDIGARVYLGTDGVLVDGGTRFDDCANLTIGEFRRMIKLGQAWLNRLDSGEETWS